MENKTSIVSVYIDDFLLVSNTVDILEGLKRFLAQKYDTKDLSKVKTIIEWQIQTDPARTMKIDQSVFIRDLIIDKGLTEYNTNVIPMKVDFLIDRTAPNNYEKANLSTYQRLISKLIYLACGIRPDIAFVVGQLSRHNADPRRGYIQVAKKVTRYLCSIMEMGFVYRRKIKKCIPKNPLLYGLSSFVDSNFASNFEDQKSVMDLTSSQIEW